MTIQLRDLATELLTSIIAHIDDGRSLCALARVSTTFRELVDPFIYQSLSLRNAMEAYRIRKAITARPERAKAIQLLDVGPDRWNDESLGGQVKWLLERCVGLREFTLESPSVNEGFFFTDQTNHILTGMFDIMCEPAFQGLRKLTLYLDGERQRYWDPNRRVGPWGSWADILCQPTLTELTVGCACIHSDVPFADAGSSKLRVLNLIQCNVSPGGLIKMLAAPKALRKLHLEENSWYGLEGYELDTTRERDYNQLSALHQEDFLKALTQQASSLESLTYLAKNPYLTPDFDLPTRDPPPQDLRDFVVLQDVGLSALEFEYWNVLLSPRGPPKLARLRFEMLTHQFCPMDEDWEPPDSELSLAALETMFARLNTPSLLKSASPEALAHLDALAIIVKDRRPVDIAIVPLDTSERTWASLLSRYWEAKGVKLTVVSRHKIAYKPPYLFGEADKVLEVEEWPTQRTIFSVDGDGIDRVSFESTLVAPEMTTLYMDPRMLDVLRKKRSLLED